PTVAELDKSDGISCSQRDRRFSRSLLDPPSHTYRRRLCPTLPKCARIEVLRNCEEFKFRVPEFRLKCFLCCTKKQDVSQMSWVPWISTSHRLLSKMRSS
ncbi:hypothetical protein PMAYCL1PPCAC_31235, partial [Pristionchus mayeri]